jgi:hypothetical protein
LTTGRTAGSIIAAIIATHATTNAPSDMLVSMALMPSMEVPPTSGAMRADHHQPATASSSSATGTPIVTTAPSRRKGTPELITPMSMTRGQPSQIAAKRSRHRRSTAERTQEAAAKVMVSRVDPVQWPCHA